MVPIEARRDVRSTDPNPYQPPNAPVADVSPGREMPPQPTTVLIALVLLWAKLSIGSLRTLAAAFRESPAGLPVWVEPLRIATAVVFIVLVGWLIFRIGTGRRWARITYLFVVLCALGWLTFEVVGGIGIPVTLTVGLLIENALPLFAMVLLFTPSANAWFRSAT
jgi:hypothetical protein